MSTVVIAAARGIVARAFSDADLPPAGTEATDPNAAAVVLTTRLDVAERGRIYLIGCPALSVRMNVVGRTGAQISYTEDGSTPTPQSRPLLSSMVVHCPVPSSPTPVPFMTTYTRRLPTGPLAVCLSIWVVPDNPPHPTGATTASAGRTMPDNPSPNGVIELIINDVGVDPSP